METVLNYKILENGKLYFHIKLLTITKFGPDKNKPMLHRNIMFNQNSRM